MNPYCFFKISNLVERLLAVFVREKIPHGLINLRLLAVKQVIQPGGL